jgi:hypothetical protein
LASAALRVDVGAFALVVRLVGLAPALAALLGALRGGAAIFLAVVVPLVAGPEVEAVEVALVLAELFLGGMLRE